HLEVTVETFRLPNLRGEQPRSHGVIEEIGVVELLSVLDHLSDEQRVRHTDACEQTCAQNIAPNLCRAVSRGRLRFDVNGLGHRSSFLPVEWLDDSDTSLRWPHLRWIT